MKEGAGRMKMPVDVGGWKLRWDPERAADYVRSGNWWNKTVADFCAERLESTPDHVIVIEGDLVFTVRDIHDEAHRLARALVGRGLEPGAVISFQLPNWREAVVIGLAAAMAGLILNPITPIYRDSEVGYMLSDCRSRLLFIPERHRKFDHASMIRRLLPGLEPRPDIIVVRGEPGEFSSYESLLDEASPSAPLPGADPDSIKMIMYTSGTTGRAKGVLHTHNSLQAENRARQLHLGVNDRDILYNPSTVTHVTGALYSLCLPFTLGAATILADVWEPAAALATMRRHRVTGMIASTIFLDQLLAEAKNQDEHLETLRFYLCGGAQVRAELIDEASRQFPNCVFARIYGSTEVPNITAGINSRAQARSGARTDGQIWGCECRVVDPVSGEPLPRGSEGEFVARGPQMFLGYTRSEDNDGAFDSDGYFRMGDLGRILEDDFLVVTGRKKDLIIRAGENISPKEVEDVLLGHPAISDVAIVAMPNERTGELACAFVIPNEGTSIDLAEIRKFLVAGGLAIQKVPEHLELVDAFPRTAIGKVRKDILRDRARELTVQTSV
jgi:acyl-CoA synthetase (AMP-forming)/AMP-acid ligase II